MDRTTRIALLGALALLVALGGTALATRVPVADDAGQQLADEHEDEAADEADDPVEQAAVDRAAERLGVEAGRVGELAAEHGLGTAVRLLAWEQEGVDVAVVLERRAAGEGWGVIARDLGVHPGIGSVMGNGGGHGRDNAPGQQQDDSGD